MKELHENYKKILEVMKLMGGKNLKALDIMRELQDTKTVNLLAKMDYLDLVTYDITKHSYSLAI